MERLPQSPYESLKNCIAAHLNSAAQDFFEIGGLLRQVKAEKLYLEGGYSSLGAFAKAELGLSASSTSRFMAINARFSADDGSHLDQKYIGMGPGKLQEMLDLPDEALEMVTPETTVQEIRAMKKQDKPLSALGFPKTIQPEGSLITTPGCGNGKYDCFCCARCCSIRQEDRNCRTAPLGAPFSCTQMSEEKRLDIEAGIYRDKCQLLNLELAPVRAGDKEPDPCCLHCEHETCFSRCGVAKTSDEDARKKEHAELVRRQKEAEAARPEPGDRDIKAFYDWARIKAEDCIKSEDLKGRYRNACGASSRFRYEGSARGIRINGKKEITWVQLAKRLMEIQAKEHQVREVENPEEDPNILDAEFREVTEHSTEASTVPMRDQEDPADPESEGEEEPADWEEENDKGPDYKGEGTEDPKDAEDEEQDSEDDDPEYYQLKDIEELLRYHKNFLLQCVEAKAPSNLIRKHRILVDALDLFLGQALEMEERSEEGG